VLQLLTGLCTRLNCDWLSPVASLRTESNNHSFDEKFYLPETWISNFILVEVRIPCSGSVIQDFVEFVNELSRVELESNFALFV
jgi:hypothetical protein